MQGTQQQIAQHRAPFAFTGMKGRQGLMHTVVSNTICTTIQTPSAFLDVVGFLSNDNTDSCWSAVKHDAFYDLFTPRAGP